MHTVRSYTQNGPYFPPTQGIYQAASLRDLIFHVKQCMADSEEMIGLFDGEGECKGIWIDDAGPVDDGEGGMTLGMPMYVLHRPGDLPAGLWSAYVDNFKKV